MGGNFPPFKQLKNNTMENKYIQMVNEALDFWTERVTIKDERVKKWGVTIWLDKENKFVDSLYNEPNIIGDSFIVEVDDEGDESKIIQIISKKLRKN